MATQSLTLKINADMRQFRRALASTRVQVGALVAATGALATTGIVYATKQTADYEKKLQEVMTLIPGASDGMGRFGKAVLDLGVEIGATKDELVEGLYQAISARIPPENAIDFLRVAGKAAKAGVTEVNTAVDALTTVINAYSLNAEDAGKVSDMLFQTIRLGKTRFDLLANSIGTVATVAAEAGVSQEELFGAFATLTAQGKKTDEVATQIRAVINQLINPTEALSFAFGKLGVESGRALIEQKGLGGAVRAIDSVMKANNRHTNEAWTNIRAWNFATSVMGDRAAMSISDVAAMGVAAGSSGEAFLTMASTLDMAFSKIKASFDAMLIAFGQENMDRLKSGAEVVLNAMESFRKEGGLRDAIDNFNILAGILIQVANGLGNIMKLLYGIGNALSYVPGLNPGFAMRATAGLMFRHDMAKLDEPITAKDVQTGREALNVNRGVFSQGFGAGNKDLAFIAEILDQRLPRAKNSDPTRG